MPFVDLALSEAEALRDFLDEVPGPLGVLEELILQDLELLLVLTLPPLNVAVSRAVVLCLLEKGSDAVVEVFILKFIGRDVESQVGLSLLLGSHAVTEYRTRSSTDPAVSALVYK